ncbi:MAG TPA: MmcQ/YjbR family DNA-binding protein [Rhizomicrobium sp.]
MNYAAIEKLCLSLPGVTLEYPFGPAKVFKVGGKMFSLISIGENGKAEGVWFKAGETSFAILTRIKGIKPCPYLARAHWVAMEGLKPLTPKELRAYLIRAHARAAQTLSRKKRKELGLSGPD